TSRLVVALPDGLEPRTVEVASDREPAAGDESERPRLKDWHLVPLKNQWRLNVDLQSPATGNLTLTLRLVPRHATGPGTVRLPSPAPVGATMTEGYLAYRVEGLDARDKGASVLTQQLKPDQFAKLWQAGGLRDPIAPTKAYSFRNRQVDAALLMTVTAFKPAIEQDLQWVLHPDRAELTGTLKATATGTDLLLVEWDVPQAVTVAG